jgi:hypothetical protein
LKVKKIKFLRIKSLIFLQFWVSTLFLASHQKSQLFISLTPKTTPPNKYTDSSRLHSYSNKSKERHHGGEERINNKLLIHIFEASICAKLFIPFYILWVCFNIFKSIFSSLYGILLLMLYLNNLYIIYHSSNVQNELDVRNERKKERLSVK